MGFLNSFINKLRKISLYLFLVPTTALILSLLFHNLLASIIFSSTNNFKGNFPMIFECNIENKFCLLDAKPEKTTRFEECEKLDIDNYILVNNEKFLNNEYDDYFKQGNGHDIEENVPSAISKPVHAISPRLGISHPITDKSKLYFNYGHFYSEPSSSYRFRLQRESNGLVTHIGDPGMEFEKTIAYETGYSSNVRDVKDLKLKTKRYFRLSPHKAWISAFQFDAPQLRIPTKVIEFGFVDDEELYKLKEKMREDLFVPRFNVHLFNYIQESVKMAEKASAWEKENLWFEPNREFVQWFQIRGINPDEVPSFDNTIIDLKYDDECEEAFDIKDWDDSLVEIEQEMRFVIENKKHLFTVSGKVQYKKGYEIGCRYWTQHGRPIKWEQMRNASTRYPK